MIKKLHSYSLSMLLIVCPGLALAQDNGSDSPPPFESGESSLLVGGAHPAIFPDLKIDGFDYLEGSITVEDEAASVTWAPFLMNEEYSWLSETRLQLSADTIPMRDSHRRLLYPWLICAKRSRS